MASEYAELLRRGPFPGLIDPWAEDDHYFQQIHGMMLGIMVNEMTGTLIDMGYVPSKEVSLQIVEDRKPDIHVLRDVEFPRTQPELDYASAAIAVMAEPGLAVDMLEEPELEALYIREMSSDILVTVVELISPRNKTHNSGMAKYQDNRQALYLDKNVNVVEIDITRSVKRLFEHSLTGDNHYHIAVYIPGESVHIIAQEFLTPLKRFALPLRKEVIPLNLQAAYDSAFHQVAIAPQMFRRHQYHERGLPFPSLLTEDQRQAAVQAVEAWQQQLAALKPGA